MMLDDDGPVTEIKENPIAVPGPVAVIARVQEASHLITKHSTSKKASAEVAIIKESGQRPHVSHVRGK
jgi:hypothetical protein